MDLEARPTTILAEEGLAPRPPWFFLVAALPGGFSRWGLGLIAGWLLVLLGPTLGWAGHLRRLADWSALPSHWGEGISTRDIWEIWENGGLKHQVTNSPTVHLMGLGLVLVLWCGWRLQAEAGGVGARLGPWLLGAFDTVLIGLLPIGLVGWLVLGGLGWVGRLGIDGLGWMAFFGRPLVVMATVAALNLQWWVCRLGRSAGLSRGYWTHLEGCLWQVWGHPIQWGLLNLAGAALRALLPLLVLLLGWRLGGGSTGRVWLFLLLQVLVTGLNAWLLGWFLRTTGRFWKHDAAVRSHHATVKEALREAARS